MNTKLLFVSLCMVLMGAVASAASPEREKFVVPQGDPADLLKETNSLKLEKESTIQQVNPPSKSFITVLGGVTAGTNLNVSSYGHIVNYNFSQQLPLATFEYTHYFFEKGGKWGVNASAGYSYSAYYNTSTPTALHVVPLEAAVVYRGEWSSTQKVMPYLMAGPGSWIYFQRGLDEYNTSQAITMATATAGLAVNLNRLGWLNSRNDTEIIFQFQRNFSSNDPDNNINGNTIQIGGSLAL